MVESEACLNWYHLGCGSISEVEYAKTVWCCMTCKKQQEAYRTENGLKIFLRFVDDIVRSVEGNPGVVLEAANKSHTNFQFTIEEFHSNGKLAFLVFYVNRDSGKKSFVSGSKNSLIPALF